MTRHLLDHELAILAYALDRWSAEAGHSQKGKSRAPVRQSSKQATNTAPAVMVQVQVDEKAKADLSSLGGRITVSSPDGDWRAEITMVAGWKVQDKKGRGIALRQSDVGRAMLFADLDGTRAFRSWIADLQSMMSEDSTRAVSVRNGFTEAMTMMIASALLEAGLDVERDEIAAFLFGLCGNLQPGNQVNVATIAAFFRLDPEDLKPMEEILVGQDVLRPDGEAGRYLVNPWVMFLSTEDPEPMRSAWGTSPWSVSTSQGEDAADTSRASNSH